MLLSQYFRTYAFGEFPAEEGAGQVEAAFWTDHAGGRVQGTWLLRHRLCGRNWREKFNDILNIIIVLY